MAAGGALVPRPHGVPIGQTADRVTDNVRRTPAGGVVVPYPTPFGMPGAVAASTSHPFPLPYGFVVDGAEACVAAAGTTDTVLTFYLDGASQFTLTIPAGSTDVVSVLGQGVGDHHQKLTVAVTASGSGAAGLGGVIRWAALP